jgi:hypothetical protein
VNQQKLQKNQVHLQPESSEDRRPAVKGSEFQIVHIPWQSL